MTALEGQVWGCGAGPSTTLEGVSLVPSRLVAFPHHQAPPLLFRIPGVLSVCREIRSHATRVGVERGVALIFVVRGSLGGPLSLSSSPSACAPYWGRHVFGNAGVGHSPVAPLSVISVCPILADANGTQALMWFRKF